MRRQFPRWLFKIINSNHLADLLRFVPAPAQMIARGRKSRPHDDRHHEHRLPLEGRRFFFLISSHVQSAKPVFFSQIIVLITVFLISEEDPNAILHAEP
jgi:hypothetical protein